MALIEAGIGAQRLQFVCDAINTVSGMPTGLGGRPAIFQTGSGTAGVVMTVAQIAAATGLTSAQVTDIVFGYC